MKKAATVLSGLLFALTILFPAGVLVAGSFGYRFDPVRSFIFAIITAILSICTVGFSLQTEDAIENKTIRVLLAMITPFSLVNVVLCIGLCKYECNITGVIISVFVSAGCCCFLTVKYGKPIFLKVIALVLSALMVLPIGFFSFISWFSGSIIQDTVVQTVESPGGKYYAAVIDNNRGALGGNTFVDVHEKSEIDFIIFKIEKWPQRVYAGRWGEFENMEIYWEDEQCLVINAFEYEIGSDNK